LPHLAAGLFLRYRRRVLKRILPSTRPALLALLFARAGSCVRKDPEPYYPVRPFVGPDGRRPPEERVVSGFPERILIDTGAERLARGEVSPPELLSEIDFCIRRVRQQALLPRTAARIAALEAEIDSIRAQVDRLEISGRDVMRQRFERSTPEESEQFRRAAALYQRWGLASMRDGRVEERIAGAERIERAAEWDPSNVVPVLLLATYEDAVGFRSNALARLDRYTHDRGASDLVDLARMRKRERAWKIEGDPLSLVAAKEVAGEVARRQGGWSEASPWLLMERARLFYLADSMAQAASSAEQALTRIRGGAGDPMAEVEAHLMLGLTGTRELAFREASEHLDFALRAAMKRPATGELAAWLTVPWDQWSQEERRAFDRDPDRAGRIERFWPQTDPIWATPRVFENRVEYRRRVAEAWFAFSDLDPSTPGPLTDPGRAFLRFGVPTEWKRHGQRPLRGSSRRDLDFSVYQTWEFVYQLLGDRSRPIEGRRLSADGLRTEQSIFFQEAPGTARFSCPDSLTPPEWPPTIYNFDFLGRGYHYNASSARFRDPSGGTRLWLSFDTILPDYALRYPLQGVRFEGGASIDLTLYREQRDPRRETGRGSSSVAPESTEVVRRDGRRIWVSGPSRGLALSSESTFERTWNFKRRAGLVSLEHLAPGRVRLASLFSLRQTDGRIIGLGVDNGDTLMLRGFESEKVDASDLLLLTALPVDLPEESERTLTPSIVAYGAGLDELAVTPRASRLFLNGEPIAYYFEVYNLDISGRDSPGVEFSNALERIDEDGEVEYRVGVRGAASRLERPRVTQWNIARSLGFGDLAPGVYRLVVEVGTGGRETVLRRAAYFRVVEPEDLVALYRWRELPRP